MTRRPRAARSPSPADAARPSRHAAGRVFDWLFLPAEPTDRLPALTAAVLDTTVAAHFCQHEGTGQHHADSAFDRSAKVED